MSIKSKGQGTLEKKSEDGEKDGDGVGAKLRIGLPLVLHCNEVEQSWNYEGKNGMHVLPLIMINNRHFWICIYLKKEKEQEDV